MFAANPYGCSANYEYTYAEIREYDISNNINLHKDQ